MNSMVTVKRTSLLVVFDVEVRRARLDLYMQRRIEPFLLVCLFLISLGMLFLFLTDKKMLSLAEPLS